MMILRDAILAAMIDTGRAGNGYKLDIISIGGENGSDYRRIECTLTKPRCKKPFICWNICVDIARNLIRWDTSTFYDI